MIAITNQYDNNLFSLLFYFGGCSSQYLLVGKTEEGLEGIWYCFHCNLSTYNLDKVFMADKKILHFLLDYKF